MRPFIGGGLDIFLFKESSTFLICISAYFSTCVKLKLLWIKTPSRGYFRNWGQRPEDTEKGTFPLQKSLKGHP